MKQILMLIGSARHDGNTDQLANAFMEGALQAGHTIDKVYLNKLHGCLGCQQCRYEKPCIQKDDMQQIYPLLDKADTIVLASPLYFWTLSASIKAFIERLYAVAQKDEHPSLGRYERYPQKDCVLIMSAADDYFWTFEQAVAYYRFALIQYIGWKDKGMLLAGGCSEALKERTLKQCDLQKAYQLGYSL